MAKRHTIYQSEFPYHITARSINKSWFDIPIDQVWEIMGESLYMINRAYNFEIHAYVLMNNHYHMMGSTPDSNIDECMNYFQREVSREITKRAGRINQTWGGPYDACVVSSEAYFRNVYKYIYQNPIRAGLVNRVEEYRFSGIRGLLGFEKLLIPIKDPILFNPDFDERILTWLNDIDLEASRDIEHALRKPVFRYPKDRQRNRPARNASFRL